MRRLPRAAALALAGMLLAACAATEPPPATLVSATGFASSVAPGTTTRAGLLATLGPTRSVVFDSGYESWLYVAPLGSGRYREFVVLIGPDGVVKKTRQRSD